MAGGGSTMLAVLLVAGLLQSAAAETYTVGGKEGWTFAPTSQPTFYDDWAKQQQFFVGDELFFPYPSNHDVMEVSQMDLQACSIANPIAQYTQPNAVVKLTTAGYHGFICSLPGHCSAGMMKMNIQVLAALLSTPSVAPVAAPVVAPGVAPAVAPVVAPVASPGSSPVVAPVVAPVTAPGSAPVVAPVVAPVASPGSAPMVAPVVAPVTAPISEPISAPMNEPISAPTPEMESPPAVVIEEPTEAPAEPPSRASGLQIYFAGIAMIASGVALVL